MNSNHDGIRTTKSDRCQTSRPPALSTLTYTRVTRAYSLFHIKRTNAKQKHGNTRAYAHAARVQACRARTRSVAAGLERDEEEDGASDPARVSVDPCPL